ncbi:MAG: hypothetical protein ACQEQG_03230 [Bacillota bacterium]
MSKISDKIEAINGVISCRITGENDIKEIHIISDDSREPKRIVRDIETIVLVESGKEIDHKKISIACLNGIPELEADFNRKIELINVYQDNNSPACNYKFKLGNEVKEEYIQGSNVEGNAWLAAKGMIQIIEKYKLMNGSIQMENVSVTGRNGDAVIVEIQLFYGRNMHSGHRLVGTVYINDNLALASSRAVLKALNRQLNCPDLV